MKLSHPVLLINIIGVYGVRFINELATERKQNADFRKNISQFNIGRYLRTKILSRMTFGDVRKQLSTQYKQQKRIYGMIKNRNSS